MESVRNILFMVDCSFYYHKIFQKNNLRIIKLRNRQGDNAPMAMVEFVDYNEIYNPKGKKAKKTTRRGRSKKAEAPQVDAPATEEKSEE